MEHTIKFFPLSEISSKPTSEGGILLRVLGTLLPDTFGFLSKGIVSCQQGITSLCGDYDQPASGLLALKVDGRVACVVFLLGMRLERIGTLPAHRGKGYARFLLKWIKITTAESNFPLTSPIEPYAIPLFRSAGWEEDTGYGDPVNYEDGTVMWCPHKQDKTPGTMFNAYEWCMLLRTQM